MDLSLSCFCDDGVYCVTMLLPLLRPSSLLMLALLLLRPLTVTQMEGRPQMSSETYDLGSGDRSKYVGCTNVMQVLSGCLVMLGTGVVRVSHVTSPIPWLCSSAASARLYVAPEGMGFGIDVLHRSYMAQIGNLQHPESFETAVQ